MNDYHYKLQYACRLILTFFNCFNYYYWRLQIKCEMLQVHVVTQVSIYYIIIIIC